MDYASAGLLAVAVVATWAFLMLLIRLKAPKR